MVLNIHLFLKLRNITFYSPSASLYILETSNMEKRLINDCIFYLISHSFLVTITRSCNKGYERFFFIRLLGILMLKNY